MRRFGAAQTMPSPDGHQHRSFWLKWSTSPLAWGVPLMVAVALCQVTPFTDPDMWWHLKTGEWIVQHHALPTTNTFSHTEPNHPWLVFEWLSQVTFYLAHAALGVWGIYLLRAVLIFGTWGLWYRLALRQMREPIAAFLLLVAALAFSRYRMGERPELFSHLMIALFASWLLLRRPRTLGDWWPLWILQILWTNLHGYFFVGPLLAGWWVVRHWTTTGESWRTLPGRLAGVAALTAACLVNPYGLNIFTFLLSHKSSVVLEHVLEFRRVEHLKDLRPTFIGFLVYAVAALGVVSLKTVRAFRPAAGSPPEGPRHFARAGRPLLGVVLDALLLAVVLVMGLQHIRFLWLLLALSLPIAILGLREHDEQALFAHRLPLIPPLFTAAVAVAAMVYLWPKDWHLGWHDISYPSEAMAFVEKHDLYGTLYNDYGHGGWFIYHYYPRLQTFMDGRFAFSEAFYKKYFQVALLPRTLPPLLKEYDVALSVQPAQTHRGAFYAFYPADGEFETVYYDLRFRVHVRRDRVGGLPTFTYLCPCPGSHLDYLTRYARGSRVAAIDKEMTLLQQFSGDKASALHARWLRLTGRPRQALTLLKNHPPPERMADIQRYETMMARYALGQEANARKLARNMPPFVDREWLDALVNLDLKEQALQAARTAAENNPLHPQSASSAAFLARHSPSKLERRKWRRLAEERQEVFLKFVLLQVRQAMERGDEQDALNSLEYATTQVRDNPALSTMMDSLKKKTGAVFPEDMDPSVLGPRDRPVLPHADE